MENYQSDVNDDVIINNLNNILMCPKCGQPLKIEDFKSELFLNHLHNFLVSKEEEYKQQIINKLKAQYDADYSLRTENALLEQKNRFETYKQQLIIEHNKLLSQREMDLEKLKSELSNQVALQEQKINEVKLAQSNEFQQETYQFTDQINALKAQLNEQQLILDQKLSECKLKLTNEFEIERRASFDRIFDLQSELQKIKNNLNAELMKQQVSLLEKFNLEKAELVQTINNLNNDLNNKALIMEKQLADQQLMLKAEYEQKLLEKDNQITNLQVANAEQRAYQSKRKGEEFEHEVELDLRKAFVNDVVEKINDANIEKADFLHIVREGEDKLGTIVYEVKNTEKWSDAWEIKLQKDMVSKKSKYGILIATCFNKKFPYLPFKMSDVNRNIFLTDSESFVFVAQMIRKIILLEADLEYKLKSNKNDATLEKIKLFNNWKDIQIPKINQLFETQTTRIADSESTIIKKVDSIRIAREHIIREWKEMVIKTLDSFQF